MSCAACSEKDAKDAPQTGPATVTPTADTKIVYVQGVFDQEQGPGGTTWRWLEPQAVIRLKNTGRDMLLVLTGNADNNVLDGRILLGRWQRVFLVELDGPRSRDISVMLMGEAAQ